MQSLTTESHSWLRTFGFSTLLATMALTGCQTPVVAPLNVTSIEPGPNERVDVDRAVLLLDASGSIDWMNEYPEANAQYQSFAAAMPEGDYSVGVIHFGGSERDTIALSRQQPAQLAQKISTYKHIGEGTPLPEVIAQAGDEIAGTRGRSAIILFSDGVATRYGKTSNPEATLASARAVIEGQDGEVCFHTYQLGDDPEGKALLEELAALTPCGGFATAASLTMPTTLYAAERSVFIGPLPSVAAAPRDPDSDRDGVTDRRDQCPGTPRGAAVDSRGCWVLSNLTYDLDSAEIAHGQNRELDSVVEVMTSNPNMTIRIDGYTDSSGSADYNLGLSERRASGVRNYLEGAGIDGSRLQIRGHGESDPIADNATTDGRARNRRSELSVIEE